MHAILTRDEPEEIYRELVDGLGDDVVPPAVLAALLMASSAFVLLFVQDALVLFATTMSVLAAFVRIGVIRHHQRHREAYRTGPPAEVRRLEAVHGASIVAFSGTFSGFAPSVCLVAEGAFSLLPLCIGFGLSGGLIARISVRPRIAAAALLTLGVPGAITMALFATPTHLVGSAFIVVFTVAALQSVAFIYQTAKRGVTLRLALEAQARHDPLTGLLNRFGLSEAVTAMRPGSRRSVAVHAFDLDNFKTVNDTFGHAAGDRLLSLLAERMRTLVPDGTIAARIGGDEFVLVQWDGASETAARHLAGSLHQALTLPCEIGAGENVTVGVSLGYAVGTLPHGGFEHLHHLADAASYAVKRMGGGILAHDELAAPPLAVPA